MRSRLLDRDNGVPAGSQDSYFLASSCFSKTTLFVLYAGWATAPSTAALSTAVWHTGVNRLTVDSEQFASDCVIHHPVRQFSQSSEIRTR